MYQIDNSTASATQPASTSAGSAGFFTDGNPATGVAATIVPAEWLNSVMMELMNVLAAAGISPAKNQFNQLITALNNMHSPVVGTVRNAKMSIAAASATGAFTADEIIVATSLSGQTYRLASFNKTVNLATTGVGGMDTGSAPANGFVALYAVFNPTTGASGILAKDATSVAATSVYSGASQPAGYTASALIGLWPTDGTGKFKPGLLIDRQVSFPAVTALSTNTPAGSFTSLGISSVVPKTAKSVSGTISVGNTSASSQSTVLSVASDSNGSGLKQAQGALTSASGSGFNTPFDNLLIGTDQTIYYQATTTTGTPTYIVAISGYQF